MEASELLRRVAVRPVFPEEKDRWTDLMRQHHYLGFSSLVGESLLYVATCDDRWIALMGWSAAALKCRVRDRWIGWQSPFKEQRLSFLANNTRFLILPGISVPNLASRILSLNLRRISGDWEDVYGHPLFLLETFVDPRYFPGTCYKASNWQFLGHTRGFGRHSRKYIRHDRPKMVFVYSLDRDARASLRQAVPARKTPPALSEVKAGSLIEVLMGIPEPRKQRGIRHGKLSVLAISICAVLSGAFTFACIAEWAQRCSQKMRKRLLCRYNPRTGRYEAPSEPTIRRFLQKVDADVVDSAIGAWVQSLTGEGDVIAVDGKTLKGARGVHLLSAFLTKQGVVIAQKNVEKRTNEITMVRPLLEPLDVKGKVVTLDALHTQKDTARFLVKEKGADYVFTVKDNQSILRKDIEDLGLVSLPPSGCCDR